MFCKYTVPFYVVIFMLILSACSSVESSAPLASSHVSAAISTPTTTEKLRASANFMKNVHSLHFGLDWRIDTSGSIRVAVRDVPTSSQPLTALSGALSDFHTLQPMAGAGPMYMYISGEGDEVLPGQLQVSLKEKAGTPSGGSAPFRLVEILQQDKVYLQDRNEKWYVVTKEDILTQPGWNVYSETGLLHVNALYDLALQKGQLIDKGEEIVGGQKTRHIDAKFGKEVIQALYDSLANKEYAKKLPVSTELYDVQATVSFWIDEQKNSLVQFVTKFKYDQQVHSSDDHTYQNDIAYSQMVRLSKIDQTIKIASPQNAIPIRNINDVPPWSF